ncbi:SGNH/GDSL hydrolase family protein [Paenibacillus sp. WLX2291]|uniref:SGNH/GDSL hydrolase family protein n=1 Tax=Paenibacillus sp. WLX2291 TaxID=3296934 RepID=UPI0039840C63
MKDLFIIGDSISIQYGPYLKHMLEGHYRYDRKRGEEALYDLDQPIGANGGDSERVLQYLKSEQHNNIRYDVLLLNCGLHDIKTDRYKREKQISLEQYRENLQEILRVADQMAQHIIWIRTTDVVDDIHNQPPATFFRFHDDVLAYNAAADEIMKSEGISIIDLYTFTRCFEKSAYCDHVHYTEQVRQLQAAYIAGYLENYYLI